MWPRHSPALVLPHLRHDLRRQTLVVLSVNLRNVGLRVAEHRLRSLKAEVTPNLRRPGVTQLICVPAGEEQWLDAHISGFIRPRLIGLHDGPFDRPLIGVFRVGGLGRPLRPGLPAV